MDGYREELACMQRLAKNMPTGRLTDCVVQLIHHRIFTLLEQIEIGGLRIDRKAQRQKRLRRHTVFWNNRVGKAAVVPSAATAGGTAGFENGGFSPQKPGKAHGLQGPLLIKFRHIPAVLGQDTAP